MMRVVTMLRDATKTISPIVRNKHQLFQLEGGEERFVEFNPRSSDKTIACFGPDVVRNGLRIFQVVDFELENEGGSFRVREQPAGRIYMDISPVGIDVPKPGFENRRNAKRLFRSSHSHGSQSSHGVQDLECVAHVHPHRPGHLFADDDLVEGRRAILLDALRVRISCIEGVRISFDDMREEIRDLAFPCRINPFQRRALIARGTGNKNLVENGRSASGHVRHAADFAQNLFVLQAWESGQSGED